MKRVLSLVLAFMLVLTSIMPAFAEETATDSEAGKALESYGVIAGTDKGLDEGSALTRAQMTVILSQMYGMKAEAEAYAFAPSFTDVPEGQWFTPYVAFAEQKGWMSGDAPGGTFRPNDAMKAQEVNAMFLKALGYTVEWDDVNMKAEEIEVGVTASDTTSVLRGEAFAAMVEVLNTPKMDETDTLGTKLALPNYEPPTPPAPAAVAMTGAVAINSKMVEVSLDSDEDAPTAVTVDQFSVVDKDDAAIEVAA
ncbi:MAG: S-layer homology domain-containing protein, partial [Desulfobacterales bacterium]|nr:S-layer homology domain-containing protein [Desulfobacterales bacterium]